MKQNEDGRPLLSPRGGPAPPTERFNLRPSRLDFTNKSPQLCAWSQTSVTACKEQSQVKIRAWLNVSLGRGGVKLPPFVFED